MSATLESKEDSFKAESDVCLSKPPQTQNNLDPGQPRPKLAQTPQSQANKSQANRPQADREKCMDMHYVTLVYIYTYITYIYIHIQPRPRTQQATTMDA